MLTLRLPSTPDRSRPPPPYESPRPSSPGSEVERERQHLEEAAAHTFYRTCFWPLHVWKRSCRCALSARRMFCQRVLHLFRAHALATWKLHAGTQWTMERALLAMATSSYLHNLERCFETWLERWESTCEYIQMGSSEQFHMLRMRSLVGLPFNILRTYALCKIIVRRRSYGACLLEEEAKVPPIVFPPLASDDVCQPFYAKALREDPQQRKANRFMRQRLARPIFNSFALQVEWRRKKRFSLLCGWHLTYRQILARWISFVILDLGDEDDIEGEQLAVHACEQLRDTSGLDREEIYALKRARFTARLSRRRMGRTCGTWLKQRHETAALGGGGGRLSAGVRSHVGRWRSVRAEKLARRDSLEGWKRPTAQERFDGFIRQAQKKVNQASLERDEVIARLHQMKKRSKREQEAARVSELVLHTRQVRMRLDVGGEDGGGGRRVGREGGGTRVEGGMAFCATGKHVLPLDLEGTHVLLPAAPLPRAPSPPLPSRAEHTVPSPPSQAALRVVVEMQSSQLEEVLSRNQDEVEAMVSRRGEKLLAVYTRTKQQFDLLLLRETVAACFHALSVPMRWRRAVHVSNKLRLKRWLRICVRFRWVYEHIHIYRKYRILSAILWAWLKLIERYYTYRTPGLVRSIKIRRSRVSLFSRLLLAGKHPTCARSLFARWLEWTQTRKAARATVHLTSLITNQRLLRRCFDGFVVSVASSCVRGVSVEERAWADREAWVSFFLRPGLYSSWVRRKERWERARAERMAPAKVTAVAVTDLRAQQAARVAVERDLLFNTQARGRGWVGRGWWR
ncbi:MAG: hypothetical protein SGPRY_013732 [Prymnesium sp.]